MNEEINDDISQQFMQTKTETLDIGQPALPNSDHLIEDEKTENSKVVSSISGKNNQQKYSNLNISLFSELFDSSFNTLKTEMKIPFEDLSIEKSLSIIKWAYILELRKHENRLILPNKNKFNDQLQKVLASPLSTSSKNSSENSFHQALDFNNLDVDDIAQNLNRILPLNAQLNDISKNIQLKSHFSVKSKQDNMDEDADLSKQVYIPNIEKMLKQSKNEQSLESSENDEQEKSFFINTENSILESQVQPENFEILAEESQIDEIKETCFNNNQKIETNQIDSNLDEFPLDENIAELFESTIPDQSFHLYEDEIKINENSDENLENSNSESINQKNSLNTKFKSLNSALLMANQLLNSSSDNDQDNNDVKKTSKNTSDLSSDDEQSFLYKKRKKTVMLSDEEESLNKKSEKNSKFNSDKSLEDDRFQSISSDPSLNDDSDSSLTLKKRRKRVVMKSSDSENSDKENPLNKTRKKLRGILSDKKLREETRDAEKAEQERRERIQKKQEFYNSIIDENEKPQNSNIDRLVLDFDPDTKEVLVEVPKNILQVLKPHQVDGIKFLYENTIESIDRLINRDRSAGCILAHSMGLGKTLQVVTFLLTIMTNSHIENYIRKALIIVPLNVAKNWAEELVKWPSECNFDNPIPLFEMVNVKQFEERLRMLKMWNGRGGIMIITINLFSQLIQGKNFTKKQKPQKDTFKGLLLGPDIVVVDEGHLLKNDKTIFSNTISQIRTLRRIILTGTPLQNNLLEYYVMVDFVKPNLLGTKKEFRNRFENPITNGQHIDSTDYDVKVMKKRVHILYNLLSNCIHRRDYSVLVPYLKPKHEYVLNIRLTDIQTKLYKHYIEKLTQKSGKDVLTDYSVLRLIWNHPALLIEKDQRKNENEEEENLDDFIVASDDDEEEKFDIKNVVSNNKQDKKNTIKLTDSDSEPECVFESTRILRSQGPSEDISLAMISKNYSSNWWSEYIKDEDASYRIEISSKFILLMAFLEKCEIIGDKVLVFSQSLDNLNMIEYVLENKMKEYQQSDKKTPGVTHRWIPNIDFFRIDGQVSVAVRQNIINRFNDIDNYRARLMLISTKAGGLGINLVGANRCIIFDVSWNPSHDLQAIYRIYRYGQEKPVYIYRFSAFGTMESKIYDRQIIKQSMSRRVIDEQQITRHFKQSDLADLYMFTEQPPQNQEFPEFPKDHLLADIIREHSDLIINYHKHDSLLENRPEEDLTAEERKLAWTEYERIKNGLFVAPDQNQQTTNVVPFNGVNPPAGSSNIVSDFWYEYNKKLFENSIKQAQSSPLISNNLIFNEMSRTNSYNASNECIKNYYSRLVEIHKSRQETKSKNFNLVQASSSALPPIDSSKPNQAKFKSICVSIKKNIFRNALLPEWYGTITKQQMHKEFSQFNGVFDQQNKNHILRYYFYVALIAEELKNHHQVYENLRKIKQELDQFLINCFPQFPRILDEIVQSVKNFPYKDTPVMEVESFLDNNKVASDPIEVIEIESD